MMIGRGRLLVQSICGPRYHPTSIVFVSIAKAPCLFYRKEKVRGFTIICCYYGLSETTIALLLIIRAPKSSEAYKSIGGGSPIVKYTQAQADLVQETLRRRGYNNASCYFAMRYWKPYTEDVLEKMKSDGINTMVIVPLYPQFSISTSGSSLRLLQDIFYKTPQIWGEEKIAHTVVPAWYHRPGYLKVMAKLIIDQIQQYSTSEMQDGLHVLFSAHGVPQSYIEAGDPYQRQIEECVDLISKEVQKQLLKTPSVASSVASKLAGSQLRLIHSDDDMITKVEKLFAARSEEERGYTDEEMKIKPVQFHLSFQSRVGPVKWLQPYTEETLHQLGANGVKNLIVVPVSFVSEHIETLEEIDMEYKEIAHESGIVNWKRVPALNTEPLFIEDLANLVEEALESPSLSVAEAASNSYSDILDAATLSTIDASKSSTKRKSH